MPNAADAPVQAIQLDPNLLVNARHTGAADAYNYGQGAQDYREAQTVSTVMGARYNYGPEAFDVRERTTEYNTGQGAQDYRNSMTRSNNMSATYNYGPTADRIRVADEAYRNSPDQYAARRALTRNVEEGTNFNYSQDQYEGVRIDNRAKALESDYLHGEQARGIRALESDYLHGEQARGARSAEANFRFGALARDQVQADIDATRAQSGFLYGPGGVRSRELRDEHQEAQTENLREGTAHDYNRTTRALQRETLRGRELGNDAAKFENTKRQAAYDSFQATLNDNIRRDAELEQQRLERDAKIASTPAMEQQYMKTKMNEGTARYQQSLLQVQSSGAEIKQSQLRNEKEFHRLHREAASERIETEQTLNAQDTTNAFDKAFAEDLDRQRTFGKGDHKILLNQMEDRLTSTPESARTSQEDYVRYIQKIEESDAALSPQARNQLKRIKRAVDYRSAEDAISGTVRGLAAARDSGGGTEADNQLLSAIAATGINPNNPDDLKKLAYEKTADGYAVRNTTRAGSTQPISEAQFNSAAAHHTLFTESGRKTETHSNILTQPSQQQDLMESVDSSNFDLKTSVHYKDVYNSTIDHVDDKESYTKQTADNMKQMQQTAKVFNPYKSAYADKIFEGLGYGQNVMTTLGGKTTSLARTANVLGVRTSASAKLERFLKDNPDEARKMVEYYYNRQWGGVPEDMYHRGIDRQMRTFESNSPSATAGMEPLEKEKFNRSMRSTIQAGMHNEVVADDVAEAGYRFAINAVPDLAIPGYMTSDTDKGPAKEDPRGFLTRVASSIKEHTIGLSRSDAFRTATVASPPAQDEFLE